MQGLIRPGDIVLLAHDCHKSHPYAVILAGAHPVYLDAYPLSEYSMYGGVTLVEIKRRLLELKRNGKLDRVRMLLLTNITFDGIAYDPMRRKLRERNVWRIDRNHERQRLAPALAIHRPNNRATDSQASALSIALQANRLADGIRRTIAQ